MDTLIHVNEVSVVEKDNYNTRLLSSQKPDFSFEYDELQYHEANKGYVVGSNFVEMTDAQAAEVAAYIAGVEEDVVTGEKVRINTDNLLYLAETDWYAIRETETGVLMPEDVKLKRAEARAAITEIV